MTSSVAPTRAGAAAQSISRRLDSTAPVPPGPTRLGSGCPRESAGLQTGYGRCSCPAVAASTLGKPETRDSGKKTPQRPLASHPQGRTAYSCPYVDLENSRRIPGDRIRESETSPLPTFLTISVGQATHSEY